MSSAKGLSLACVFDWSRNVSRAMWQG
ncbi:unnamed protein product [Ectocarpus sp. CCAP 1310/34]|nr:unnamed protein product [Ectocarpus sp. CCAP 1310/34]